MNIRRALGILAIVALGATGAACSSKSDESKKKATTTTAANDAEATTTTVSDEDFASAMKQIRSGIEGAGGDECKLVEAVSANPPSPANAAQNKEFVDTYAALLNSISQMLGPDTDNGKALSDAATKFQTIGKDKNYEPGLLQTEEISTLMGSSEVSAALMEFSTKSQKCMSTDSGDGATTETTAPEG